MPEQVYLDWNAPAPLRPEARAAMAAALDVTGNPSSVKPQGTEIAGSPVTVMSEHARIQSMYVGNGTPLISVT